MASRSDRRAQILDAAVDVIATRGVGGLTHRIVDEYAGLPSGTTSNRFRTRLALLEATAAHTVELHWHHVEAVQLLIGGHIDRVGLIDLLTHLITNPDPHYRSRTRTRLELFLEGTRTPELQPFLNDLHGAALKAARVVLEATGLQPDDAQVDELTRVLNGLMFSTLTLAPDRPPPPLRATIEHLLAAIIDPSRTPARRDKPSA